MTPPKPLWYINVNGAQEELPRLVDTVHDLDARFVIEQHGQPVAVVLSVAEYERLRTAEYEPIRTPTTEELPASDAVSKYMPAIGKRASLVMLERYVEPMERGDFVHTGVLAFLEAWPRKGRSTAVSYALNRVHWAMRVLAADRGLGLTGNTTHTRSSLVSGIPVADVENLGPAAPAESIVLSRRFKRAIRSLRNPHRDVLWAMYVDYIHGADLARKMGVTDAVVYYYEKQGLALLRWKLTGQAPSDRLRLKRSLTVRQARNYFWHPKRGLVRG